MEWLAPAHASEENACQILVQLLSCPRGPAHWPTLSRSHQRPLLRTGWPQGKPISDPLSLQAPPSHTWPPLALITSPHTNKTLFA